MNDLISRQDVLDYIDNMPSKLTSDGRRMVRRFRLTEYIANTLPSAKPERKKGQWIEINGTPSFIWLRCSECRYGINCRTNFCPNCGAEMREEH